MTDDDGNKQSVDFTLEAGIKASQAAPGKIPAGSGCQPNPQRDLVIPFSIKLTSLTSGFDYKVKYGFKPVTLDNDRLVGYIDLPGGGICVDRFGLVTSEGPELRFNSSVPVKTGGDTHTTGYITYRDFFTPAGDKKTELAKVYLDLGSAPDHNVTGMGDMTASSGPVCSARAGGFTGHMNVYVAPLDGKSRADAKGPSGLDGAVCSSVSSSTAATAPTTHPSPSGPVTKGNIPG